MLVGDSIGIDFQSRLVLIRRNSAVEELLTGHEIYGALSSE